MPKRPSTPDDSPPTRAKTLEPKTLELPLVALRETVIFPEMIVPLQVGREKSVNALNAAVAEGGPIALVTQRQAEQEDISETSELYAVGTLAKIAQVVQLQDGTVRAIVQGQSRLRLHRFVARPSRTSAASSRSCPTTPRPTSRSRRSCARSRPRSSSTSPTARPSRRRPPSPPATSREPGLLADMVAYSPDMTTEQRQELLETVDVVERLKLVSNFLARQIEILELKGRIQSEVKSEMDKTQREYILREQLKAIQRELGEDDPQQAEINELREKVEAAGMPEEIKTRAIKEIDRMSRIPSATPGGRRHPDLRRLADRPAVERRRPTTTSTSRRPPRSSTRTTTASRRSRSGSSSTSRSARSPTRSAARSSPSSARPASARRRSARASPGRWAASSSG